MTVRRFVIVAVAAGAVAGPVAAGASAPVVLAATSVQAQGVTRAAEGASGEVEAIDLEVKRRGSLAATLTWSGGAGPYKVLIDPSKGAGSYESGIDETTLTVAAEPDRGYCFEVFGADGAKSSRECVSRPRL
jgi:hypothetical protein